jgi:CDGSH-type Zn-finger protein
MCGLSRNQPFFCDGSHKKTADEAAGKVYYVYHEDGTRKEVSDAFRG